MEYLIEEWMEKYDKETESRNIEIQMLKEKREDQALAYRELEETVCFITVISFTRCFKICRLGCLWNG